MFVNKMRAEKKRLVQELKKANIQLKHEKVVSEKLKQQAMKTKKSVSNMNPMNTTRSKSNNKSFADNSYTKHSKDDVSVDRDTANGGIEVDNDFNIKAVINKRQSAIKETFTKLSKELANEELEIKALQAELNT